MAEYIFRHRVGKDAEWQSCSAGVWAMHGSPASKYAIDALAEWDIDLTPHKSQPLTAELVAASNLVAVMTDQHHREIVSQFPDAADRVRLLMSFGTSGIDRNVGDPIGLSLHVYRTIRDQIDSALADLILYLMQK